MSPNISFSNQDTIKDFYSKRMIIEETFRDLKSQRMNIEKMRLRRFSRIELMLKLLVMIYNLLLELGLALLKREEYKKMKLCAKINVISIACDVIISVVWVVDMSFRRVFE